VIDHFSLCHSNWKHDEGPRIQLSPRIDPDLYEEDDYQQVQWEGSIIFHNSRVFLNMFEKRDRKFYAWICIVGNQDEASGYRSVITVSGNGTELRKEGKVLSIRDETRVGDHFFMHEANVEQMHANHKLQIVFSIQRA
jgi:hypothetical protein